MTLLIVGNESQLAETKEKFGPAHEYLVAEQVAMGGELISRADVVFDFANEWTPLRLQTYLEHPSITVFLHTVTQTLRQLIGSISTPPGHIFGFNGLPTFLDRPLLEVSMLHEANEARLAEACRLLKTEYKVVQDTVGLVTPRVIGMIINEAYLTVEEGTASRSDIDLAMKLGTNYPFGPFEWASRIGLANVVSLLEAIHNDTGDERYRICPLLLAEANGGNLGK